MCVTLYILMALGPWLYVGLGLLVIILAITLVIVRKKQANIERHAQDLEQQLLRTQMNPHFIFNAMNSIQRFILSNEQDEAYDYMEKFASLMRKIMDNSNTKFISLEEEIETLKLYMDLEALRFEDNFGYEVTVADDIDQVTTKIPAMLMQPYVENAIWHGLVPQKKGGKVQINIRNKGDHLVCMILDNGIGRQRSKELQKNNNSTHKSVGLLKTKERLKMLFTNADFQIDIRIEDMIDSFGNPLGTKVLLQLPVE